MIDSRYQSQKSSNVRWYSALDRVREVEGARGRPRAPARVASIRARIQRSSTDDGRASGSTAPAISRSRLAFQSLFASFRPSSIVPNEKRGSWRRRHLEQPVPRRVGAVLLDRVDRVDAGAEACFDMRRPSGVSSVEWMTTSVNGTSPSSSRPEKIMRCDPEEDDVARGREHVARVEARELGRLVGPAERRERIERRREPRVEDVLVLRAARPSRTRRTRPARSRRR